MLRRFLRFASGVTVLVALPLAVASAAQSNSAQTYASDTRLQAGTIVQIDNKDTHKVAPATQSDLNDMFGVTVDGHTQTLTISGDGTSNGVFVVTGGSYPVLVTDQNGPIKKGDYLSVSAIAGIAMKADPKQTLVFGRALADFTGTDNILGSATLKDTSGKDYKKVSIGSVGVAIDIRKNPYEKSTKANLPPALQRLGEAVAEKPVGPMRIYFSIVIIVISVVTAIVLLYSGVRNSLISIGRNPLSKKQIFRGLLEIILTGLTILLIGMFAVYLLLKL